MNLKNTISMSALLITLTGLPVFGLKEAINETKPTEFYLAPLNFGPPPEIAMQKYNEKLKKLQEKQEKIQPVTSLEKIDSSEFFKIEEKLKKIDFSYVGDNYIFDDTAYDDFKKIIKNDLFDKKVKGLDFHVSPFQTNDKKNDLFYWVCWESVEDWVDPGFSKASEECSELGNKCDYDEDFKLLIQKQYKIHLMPHNKKEGIKVIALLLYLLKNNPDFRKYAYRFKFMKNFYTDQQDDTGKICAPIVIYPVWGKKSAQNILTILALALKEIQFVGSQTIPRYSSTLPMQGLTFSMGDGDRKSNKEYLKFFDKKKNYSVCSNTYFNNNKDYELTLGENKK
jgi:hypothetical protein